MSKNRQTDQARLKVPETRRRALTSLPLPKLPEESVSLAMEIESDNYDQYSAAQTYSATEPMSPQSNSCQKAGLNSTLPSINTPQLMMSPTVAKQSRFETQNQIYFNTARNKLANCQATDFFTRHEITEKLRARMMDWMIEVLKIYQQSEDTIFRAFGIMDDYLSLTSGVVKPADLHLLGSTCMFIASKQEEIRPIKLTALAVDICKEKIPVEQIMAKELEVLLTVGFRSQRPDILAVLRCALNVIGITDAQVFSFVENISVLIAKMTLFFREVTTKYTVLETSAAILIMALKLTESVQSGFNASPHIQRVVSEFGIQEQFLMGVIFLMNKCLINFEQTFPYVRNVEAFHKFAG